MASGLIGSLAAMIIREASLSSQASREMLRLTRIEQAELKPMRRSNSVDSLSPKSRFLIAAFVVVGHLRRSSGGSRRRLAVLFLPISLAAFGARSEAKSCFRIVNSSGSTMSILQSGLKKSLY
jgi:hypothetical protein